jgi:hypothetical protein
MNERIRELEAQCWEARQYGPPWFDAKRFAELIVKECAKIADDGCGSACFGLGINGAMLKEHFGVEE